MVELEGLVIYVALLLIILQLSTYSYLFIALFSTSLMWKGEYTYIGAVRLNVAA